MQAASARNRIKVTPRCKYGETEAPRRSHTKRLRHTDGRVQRSQLQRAFSGASISGELSSTRDAIRSVNAALMLWGGQRQ
jgi:hypothetical protein